MGAALHPSSVTPPLSAPTTRTTYRPELLPTSTPSTPVTTPAPEPRRSTGDAFIRGSTPGSSASSPRDGGSSSVSADPSLAAELRSRRSIAGDGREVRSPVVGQARGSGGGTTMRGNLQDELARLGSAAPTPPDAAFRGFDTAADVATVRTGLGTARDQMRSGDYAAAERTLHGLNADHSMGFYGNGNLGTRGAEAAQTLERQAGVCARMETRLGRDVSCPPSEADTRAYFRSFNNDRERPQAQDAFRDYTRAFYTHTQTALDPSSDISYSADRPQLVYGGQIYANGDRSAPAEAVRVTTHAPDSWADVTSARQTVGMGGRGGGEHAGRRAIDCEGYAYLSSTLMGEAGYRVEHLTVGRPDGRSAPTDLHAMTQLTDPSSGARLVQSNGDFYSDAYTGYTSAVRVGAFESPRYFRADTMRDSQTLAMDPAAPR